MELPEPGAVVLRLAAVLALVLANAFFVAAEFGLVGSRKTRLDEMARAGSRGARLARQAIRRLNRVISATQTGITAASLALGWLGEPMIAALLQSAFTGLPGALAPVATHSVAATIAFIAITVLHIVLGELVPKALAILYPERTSEWVAGPLLGFTWLLAGPIALLDGAANALLRLFRIRAPSHQERLHSPEEIRMLVEQSEEGGRLEKEDARLLEGVFEFSEKNAEEVMTPRTDMVSVGALETVETAADVVARTGRSRYPVTGGSPDDIVGVVHAKDVLAAVRHAPGAEVRAIMRAPLFVPGTREVEDVLADMKRLKAHLAVVLDEYGGTAGLVTMEDLLEEIVGPIYDEHDRPAGSPPPSGATSPPPPGPGSSLVDGSLPITAFNEAFGAALDRSHYTTVGGFVFGLLGRLPAVGDRVASNGLVFEVAAMEGKRVTRVRVVGDNV